MGVAYTRGRLTRARTSMYGIVDIECVLCCRDSEIAGLDANVTCEIYTTRIESMGEMDATLMSHALLKERFQTCLRHAVSTYRTYCTYCPALLPYSPEQAPPIKAIVYLEHSFYIGRLLGRLRYNISISRGMVNNILFLGGGINE